MSPHHSHSPYVFIDDCSCSCMFTEKLPILQNSFLSLVQYLIPIRLTDFYPSFNQTTSRCNNVVFSANPMEIIQIARRHLSCIFTGLQAIIPDTCKAWKFETHIHKFYYWTLWLHENPPTSLYSIKIRLGGWLRRLKDHITKQRQSFLLLSLL
jgi:hypothetical protein